jgi:hypothetical protein
MRALIAFAIVVRPAARVRMSWWPTGAGSLDTFVASVSLQSHSKHRLQLVISASSSSSHASLTLRQHGFLVLHVVHLTTVVAIASYHGDIDCRQLRSPAIVNPCRCRRRELRADFPPVSLTKQVYHWLSAQETALMLSISY